MTAFQSLVELGEHMGHDTAPGMIVADPGVPVSAWDDSSVMDVWKTQPAVRKVLDFKARLIASTSLHCYTRVPGGRMRDRTSLVAQTLDDPAQDPASTPYAFWHSYVLDRLIYDRACALVGVGPTGAPVLVRVPARRWKPVTDAFDRVVAVQVTDKHGHAGRYPTSDFILSIGYAQSGGAGTSPVLTLSDLITEMREAVTYRRGMWKRGARVSGLVLREKPWSSDTARNRFVEQWREFRQGGSREGGTALLEDGMKYEPIEQWSPHDVQDLEGRRLTDVEVASFFHVPPELVGARQGNYSNMDAFRQMLYRDTLGPDIAEWEQAVNKGLSVHLVDGAYIEAHIEGKLRGSFMEQAEVLAASTGAPWMLRQEARERLNLPPIDGADELVVPLNVLVGGQASPRDGVTAGGGGRLVETQPATASSGYTPDEIARLITAAATLIRSGFAPEASLLAVGLDPVEHLGLLPVTVQRPEAAVNPDTEIEDALKQATEIRAKAGRRLGKGRAPDSYEAKHTQVLEQFFARQASVVQSRLGAGKDWWDRDRWDLELTNDLSALHLLTATTAAKAALADAGLDPDEYDEDRTIAFLRAAAQRSSLQINATTRDQVSAALAEPPADDEDDAAANPVTAVFALAAAQRAPQIAAVAVTFASGFGSTESARQRGGGATKTWRTTSSNPRPSHKALNGDTVGLDETFSNGLLWPGAAGADEDETAGCRCSVTISY